MDKIKEFDKFPFQLIKGFDLTFQKLIAFKKHKNMPFVLKRNGRIMKISAEVMEKQRELKDSKQNKPYKKKDEVQFANEPSEKVKKKK